MSTAPDDIDKLIDQIGDEPATGDFIEFSFDADTKAPSKKRRRSLRDRERLLQGVGAVLTVRRAAELLPLNDADGRRWLREQGLIRKILNTEVVVWAEVLEAPAPCEDALPEQSPPSRPQRRKRKVLPRVEITPLATGTDG